MSWLRRRRCRHDILRSIHGDEIISVGWKRSQCLDCGRYFPDLPSNRVVGLGVSREMPIGGGDD